MSTRVEDLYALVPADAADDAVDRLTVRVLPSDVEVRRPAPGRYRRLDERLHDDATGTARGLLRGAAPGAAAGALVALLAGTTLAAGVLITFGFAAFGALIGGVVGLQRTEPEDDDPAVDVLVADDVADVRLVVVLSPHERDWARRLLERDLDAVLLESDAPDVEEPAPVEEQISGAAPTRPRQAPPR